MAQDPLLLLGPVTWYVFVMAATPGPNNAMLTASGMNFGLARTWPHIAGITFGLTLLMLLCGLGLGTVFATWPEAQTALAVAGSLYLLYLAWRVATADAPRAAEEARPLRFVEAFGFQFLNPKGWVASLTAVPLMPALGSVPEQAAVLAGLAMATTLPSTAVWALFGVGIARLFQRPAVRRSINALLAILLIAMIPFMFR
ncbi:MAG: LysE family translocator [Alphaproteobacteria bacterium]|nr:LysE family translocator [Alphaproteobacteria bacterium]MCB9930222.1 LysE family translocator [Alphaproteobacteria bacterium]